MTTKKAMITVVPLLVFLVSGAILQAADSRSHPVTAVYCTGDTVTIYPYSRVTRNDSTVFQCYEVRTLAMEGGFRYRFEDQTDMDYNDVIIDLWTTENHTEQPVVHVRYVSSDAGFSHQVHIVIDGTDFTVFEAGGTTPGSTFRFPLDSRECGDFELTVTPGSRAITAGEAAVYQVRVNPSGGFSSPLGLAVSGLPEGTEVNFNPPALIPAPLSTLTVHTPVSLPAGDYPFVIAADSGTLRKEVDAILAVDHPELAVRKRVNRATALPGDSLVYELEITNPGSVDLQQLVLGDTLSRHLEFLSREGPWKFSRNGPELQWTGDIKAGDTLDFVIRCRVRQGTPDGTTIGNLARIHGPPFPRDLSSNTVTTIIDAGSVEEGHIQFTKGVNLPQTEVGRMVRFYLEGRNTSANTLYDIRFRDILPSGFEYVGGSSLLNGAKFPDPQGRTTLTWNLPDLRPGEKNRLSFQLLIGSNARRGKNVNRGLLLGRDASGQTIRREAARMINVSTAGLVFFCGLEGTVFEDRDGDEYYSPADYPLEGMEVRLSTGEKILTDRQGRYRFTGLFPGTYAVGINRTLLPERYARGKTESRVVVLMDGLTDTVDLPLRVREYDPNQPAKLQGTVFLDADGNHRRDSGEGLLETFRVTVDGRLTTRGREGRFVLSRLQEGSHELVFHYQGRTFRKTVKLVKGDNRLLFPLPHSDIQIHISSQGDNQ